MGLHYPKYIKTPSGEDFIVHNEEEENSILGNKEKEVNKENENPSAPWGDKEGWNNNKSSGE